MVDDLNWKDEPRINILQKYVNISGHRMYVEVELAKTKVFFKATKNPCNLGAKTLETWIWRKRFKQLMKSEENTSMNTLVKLVKCLEVHDHTLWLNETKAN